MEGSCPFSVEGAGCAGVGVFRLVIGTESFMASRVARMSDTLLIIDGHSMAFRAFYALPADKFVTKSGQCTNAVYGFVSMLVKLLETESPSHIGVAFDVSRESFRTKEYPDYKGTRDATPEEFKGQVELISQVLDTMGIVSLRKDGYEADDILATLAKQGSEKGMRVLVVSGDRDSFQTVTDSVTVLYPGMSPGDLRRMTPEAVEAKYGVPPERYPEIAALVGETSDNLPGVPGVGPKTAAQWINSFDGLDNLLSRATEVKGKRGEALREHMEDVKRNRRLNHLLTDLELDVQVGDLNRGATRKAELFSLFDSLEFGNLRSRVMAVSGIGAEPGGENEDAGPGGFTWDADLDVTLASASSDLGGWFQNAGPLQAVFVLGSGVPARGHIERFAIWAEDKALILDPAILDPKQEAELLERLAGAQLIVHDAKALSHALRAQGWDMPWPSKDVQLAAYLVRPDSRSVSIDDLLNRYLDVPKEEEVASDALFEMGASTEELLSPSELRAARTVRALPVLWEILAKSLEESKELSLLEDVELPVSKVLADMEDTGIRVDLGVLEAQSRDFGVEVEAARAEAIEVIGEDVNLSSPKQLQRILFEVLDLPKTKKTKTGYTTNAEALLDLRERARFQGGPGFVFLDRLLVHRDRIKLKQMVDTLISTVLPDGRIHSSFSQVVAATGRLASADPNLQNIPARTPDGVRIRSAFIAGQGYESLMSADYSQIEMRIMAHLSKDAGLIEAFASGEDLHKTMASMVFGTPVEQVTPEQRSRIKATSYGLAYGLSSYGLARQLKIPVPEAAALRDRYFERFAGVRDYLESLVEQARIDGYTATMFGRRRYLPDLASSNRQRREMAERAALNAPIQGSAADIIKIAMVNVAEALTKAELKSRLLVQIHDELLVEIAEGEAQRVEEIVRREMASPVEMSVALDVAVGIGANWMAAAH